MKTQEDIEQLFRKYLNQECTLSEINELLDYFEIDKNEALLKQSIASYFNSDKKTGETNQHLDAVAEVRDKLIHRIREYNEPKKSIKLWPRIAIVAAVFIIIFSIGLLYVLNQQTKPKNPTAHVNDVAPGKEGATLTLANGKKILINDALSGNIANQSGVKISKTKDGQIVYEVLDQKSDGIHYNTLTTTRGEQISVRLPDGTLVFLNAATMLKYPTSFAKMNKREVSITGEGYFEVFKDKTHPFIVTTANQQIEVLGTHFNVNAYTDEPSVKTTLLEGSVKVNSNSHSEILQPNQQSTLTGNKITIKEVDTEEIVAWKNNEFLFKDDDFKTNMRKIARWYNVDVIYEDDAPNSFKLGGFSSRSRSLATILKLMEQTGKVHFRIDGKKVYVSK